MLAALMRRIAGHPLVLDRLGAVGLRIRLERPERRNAIAIATAAALADLLEQIALLTDIRLVVMAGAGDDFCSGVDLGDTSRDIRGNLETMARLFAALAALPQFSVALIRGVAFGAGIGLASACDMAIATADARFACPEVRHGLIPSIISPYIVAAIGRRAAIELFATGRAIDARRACDLGLVGLVVANPAALAAAEAELVVAMARVAPGAAREAKALGTRSIGAALIAGTIARTEERMRSDEAREGLRAFRDRRQPAWIGDRA